MVGLIPNILVKLIRETAGDDALAEINRRAEVPNDRIYELNSVYPDIEWQRLFQAACDVLGVSGRQADALYADRFCRDVLERWPVWFQMSRNSREFLIRQQAIHNAFGTGLRNPAEREAVRDKFHLIQADNSLTTHYCSPNRHCGLYIALAQWIVNHYGDSARIEELLCMKHGAAECQIQIVWDRLAGT